MMAFQNNQLSYDLSPTEKASMVMVLDQFAEYLTTIHEIKNMLIVPGSVVLSAQEAVILARLIAPYYPHLEQRLLNHPGIVRYPALSANAASGRFSELVERCK